MESKRFNLRDAKHSAEVFTVSGSKVTITGFDTTVHYGIFGLLNGRSNQWANNGEHYSGDEKLNLITRTHVPGEPFDISCLGQPAITRSGLRVADLTIVESAHQRGQVLSGFVVEKDGWRQARFWNKNGLYGFRPGKLDLFVAPDPGRIRIHEAMERFAVVLDDLQTAIREFKKSLDEKI